MLAILAAIALAQPAPEPPRFPAAHRITHTVNAYACFSPDGSRLLFQSNARGDWDIYSIRPNGNDLRPVIESPGADITPIYAPAGDRFVFVSERDGNREVYIADVDGRNQVNLTNHPAHDLHPVFSPDGTRILFSSNRDKADTDDYDLYHMSADGADLRRITSGPEVDTYASWSPDGTKIVTRRVIDGNNSEVFLLDADGGNPVNLTNSADDYDGWPVWSPDGARIAFAAGPRNRFIYLMNADGSNKRQLTGPWLPGVDHCYDTQPAFSRDGRLLAFTRYRPITRHESAEIFIMTIPRG